MLLQSSKKKEGTETILWPPLASQICHDWWKRHFVMNFPQYTSLHLCLETSTAHLSRFSYHRFKSYLITKNEKQDIEYYLVMWTNVKPQAGAYVGNGENSIRESDQFSLRRWSPGIDGCLIHEDLCRKQQLGKAKPGAQRVWTPADESEPALIHWNMSVSAGAFAFYDLYNGQTRIKEQKVPVKWNSCYGHSWIDSSNDLVSIRHIRCSGIHVSRVNVQHQVQECDPICYKVRVKDLYIQHALPWSEANANRDDHEVIGSNKYHERAPVLHNYWVRMQNILDEYSAWQAAVPAFIFTQTLANIRPK